MNIEYKSIADMRLAILHNLHKFPHDIDLVVGIPRSGMLPANLIALYLNKPFTDIDSFVAGRVYSSGERTKFSGEYKSGKVLIVDDSIALGVALGKAKENLANNPSLSDLTLIWSVVYASGEGADKVDVYCEKTGLYRVFEWNIFHHPHFIPHCCCDIDGVLCPNPPIDDDGPLYTEYISKAPILYKPTRKIDTLVSCRLEKYRSITEEWLHSNGIEYGKLIMLNFKNKEERIAWGKHGVYKGEYYKKSDNILFIESSLGEAKDILRVSGKPVFCTENFEMLNNETVSYKTHSKIKKIKAFIKKLILR